MKAYRFLAVFILIISQSSFSFDLIKGSGHRDLPSFSNENKLRVWDFEDWASEQAITDYKSIISYIEEMDMAYVLSRNLSVGHIELGLNSYTGNWALSRWEHEYINDRYFEDYERATLLNKSEAFPIRVLNGTSNEQYNIGCLADSPLKSGDLEADGDVEIVLMTGQDFIVFSPQYENSVFMQRYNSRGWISAEDTQYYYDNHESSSRTDEVQYLSLIGSTTIEDYQFLTAGIRGYAKVYEGDFDSNSSHDIVVWHKTYESNLSGEQDGFTLIEDKFLHYERDLEAQALLDSGITGEYLPQETDETTIQTWLSENDLTWSAGYPSVSECEGEEGELIPEMHDALLNDPDVLQ